MSFLKVIMCGAMFAVSSLAPAAVVFSTNAPANQNGYNFRNPSAADDFALTTNSSISGVRFWAYSDDPVGLSTIGWAITTNQVGGLPENVLFSGLENATVVDTGNKLAFAPQYSVYQVDFKISPVALVANTTYWLALDTDPIFTNWSDSGFHGWVFTDHVGFGSQAAYGSPGSWAQSQSNMFDNAFQLFSDAIPSQVPEPSSIALFGLGLAAAGIIALRKRNA